MVLARRRLALRAVTGSSADMLEETKLDGIVAPVEQPVLWSHDCLAGQTGDLSERAEVLESLRAIEQGADGIPENGPTVAHTQRRRIDEKEPLCGPACAVNSNVCDTLGEFGVGPLFWLRGVNLPWWSIRGAPKHTRSGAKWIRS